MNILISGGTGFIGSHLLSRFLGEGNRCRCLVRRTKNLPAVFNNDNVELFKGDVDDVNSLENIGEKIDVAYHLAGAGHVAAVSRKHSKTAFDVNVKGTRNFIETCALTGVKRIIHFSSTAAMGLIRAPKIDETMPCRPTTPYQMSKYKGEQIAIEAGNKLGIEVVVLRPCMVYGPGGKGEFFKFCRLIKNGIFPRIGMGKNLTPIVYVEDVVQAAVNALYKGKRGQVFLIASARSHPMVEIHKLICEALDVRRFYPYVPVWLAYLVAFFMEQIAIRTGKPPTVSRMNIISVATGRVFDIRRAMQSLSYKPNMGLRLGITETVSYFRTNHLL
ncbi:MAG: NAD-dependent epimerase/dehydratase family protein [Desulfobacteraceae bacterium]